MMELETLVKLLSKFRRVEGSVEIDGREYKQVAYKIEQAGKTIYRIDLIEVG